MPGLMPTGSARDALLRELNSNAPAHGRVTHIDTIAFGTRLEVQRYGLENGLQVLLCEDHSAPVFAYHTWYRVGSGDEREGKTGLSHLFEHLMFNEMEGCPYGEFDRRLEEAGAENNAATWLDWTQYTISAPSSQLHLVVQLEAMRMNRLVLQDAQVASEKEVVANERRYRVEDDIEGAASETLWATAFQQHPYRWPTIGWMQDIEAFTTADCREFYRTFYAPNNATVVVVGDVSEASLLREVVAHYGDQPPAELPVGDAWPEPPQLEQRRVELCKPTPTEKLLLGYHGPAVGDHDHAAVTLLAEVLCGGRASRLHRKLVRELEVASDVRVFVGPFRDPGLIEISANARANRSADELLTAIDAELASVVQQPVTGQEIQRAIARVELALLAGLETVDGKASTIGFFDTLLGRPAAGFERLALLRRLGPADIRRVARRYLRQAQRTIVVVRSQQSAGEETTR